MFYIDTWLWWAYVTVCGWLGLVSVTSYLLVHLVQYIALRFPPNLKRKYHAEWAVVTGASSGIGKAIAEKLATQGINVVLVALDDALLADTTAELQKRFAHVQFRAVGVNLAAKEQAYMPAIVQATEDIHVSLLFNNAGYICTGLFADTDLERVRCNLECNACCTVPITHHFLRRMVARNARGLITFTASVAAYLPGPTATVYSPTKAFLTNFATTIAAENHDLGIDVVVIQPSPVNTNFYKTDGPALSSLHSARKAATAPMTIANELFASAGRLTVWDQGAMCAVIRLANKLLDFQLLTELVVRFGFLSSDHRALAAKSKLRHERKTS